MRILLTGGAGFIGSHAAGALIPRGHAVTAIDNLNTYYDPALKHARLARLEGKPGFHFVKVDIADAAGARRKIPVFGQGKLRRDFTYIDDIVAALVRIVETPFRAEEEGKAPHRIYNLGNSHPETVTDLIGAVEKATGRRAEIEETDGPPGDVRETYADISRAARDFGFAPRVPLAEGIARFADWFMASRNVG